MSTPAPITAAICVIGDEILSGRTRDINVQMIAETLQPIGIDVYEVRIVRDEQSEIVEAINTLRTRYTYVFTTGGIGPTHDDITADSIAAAFGVEIGEHPEVIASLGKRYCEMGMEFTAARRRMARIPFGARLIANPVSGAPGFQTGNVFTLAGVPKIARAMMEDVLPRLQGGDITRSISLRGPGLVEGEIAGPLGELATQFTNVSIGSYPWYNSREDHGVVLVARSQDGDTLAKAKHAMQSLIDSFLKAKM